MKWLAIFNALFGITYAVGYAMKGAYVAVPGWSSAFLGWLLVAYIMHQRDR